PHRLGIGLSYPRLRAYSTIARSIRSLTDVARSHSANAATASFHAWQDRTGVVAVRGLPPTGFRPAPGRLPPRCFGVMMTHSKAPVRDVRRVSLLYRQKRSVINPDSCEKSG